MTIFGYAVILGNTWEFALMSIISPQHPVQETCTETFIASSEYRLAMEEQLVAFICS